MGKGCRDEIIRKYSESLCSELRSRKAELDQKVNTVYFGGGTPSVLPLTVYSQILSTLREVGYNPPYDEFTVEVNPDDIVEKGIEYVRALVDMGVNRVSMGVQSLDDEILRWMNRRHNAATACKAYDILLEAGVQNISIDLIFGLPQLSDTAWKQTLEDVLTMGKMKPAHISAYQLSVEPGSALAEYVTKGTFTEASDELCRNQYDILCEVLNNSGYTHYEISNFALPGRAAIHNRAYWEGFSYCGLGPGAHSYRQPDCRCWNKADIARYISVYSDGKEPDCIVEKEMLTEEQQKIEKIMLALRTSRGVEQSFLYSHCDNSIIDRLLQEGELESLQDRHIRIPEKCFFISDAIISKLI